MKPQGYVPPSASPSAHEGADLHIAIILRVAGVLAVTLVVSLLVLAVFFQHMEKKYGSRTSEASPEVTTAELPPEPRLQMHPLRDLQEVRQIEDSHLNHYGWIDREHGVAQIPVDRAMVLWVQSYDATPAGASSANASPPALSPVFAKPASSGIAPAPSTNAAPNSGMIELQMRQQKAQEASHAP